MRSNFIVGFPGETEDDLAELGAFLIAARLDAIGVFGYSDEDGTEAAAAATASCDEDEIAGAGRASCRALAEELDGAARRGPDRRDGRGAGGGRDR